MAERRAIKSTIWQDEFFGMELSLLGRLVWIGLFSACADSQGRLRDIPELICSTLFPYGGASPQDIADCLSAFGERVIRYEVDGRKYIQLRKWWENQPMQYAVPSNYPAPEGWRDRIRTNYKGVKLIYNWVGQADTLEGKALMVKLEGLGRVSSWTDYVERLNPNPNPVINPDSIDDKNASSSPSENSNIIQNKIWIGIKGKGIGIPPNEFATIAPVIWDAYIRNGCDAEKTIADGKTYFNAWCRRRNKDGKFYSPNDSRWIDWWVNQEIPEQNNNKPPPDSRRKYVEGDLSEYVNH